MAEDKNIPIEVEEAAEVLDEGNIVNLKKPLNGRTALIFDFNKIQELPC